MKTGKITLQTIIQTIAFAVLAFLPAAAQPQSPAGGKPARIVDAGQRAAIIEKVIEQLNKYYIDPGLAQKMEASLRQKRDQGAYDALVEQRPFLMRLTEDLRAVSHDLHLGVWPIEMALSAPADASEEEKQRLRAVAHYNNYGFMSVARLHGNIGYLDLSYFEGIEMGSETAVAALNLLANSDALIIDVRRNGGGSDVVNLVMSYLFREPVHTMDVYSKVSQATSQRWTMAYVPGRRLADIPVYVLQSRRTASAAEDLAYSLKNLRRATLVGEVSRGAANPIEEFSFPDLSICMAVSAFKVTSPTTGTCWEGVGVAPDIAVPAEKALDAACVVAMKTLEKAETDDAIREWRKWALEMYQALLDPVMIGKEVLAGYEGSYGPAHSVQSTNGRLILTNKNKMPITLIPLGADKFAFKEEEGIVRFARDEAGIVTGMEIIFAEGYRNTLKKGFDS